MAEKPIMQQYLDLIRDVLANGEEKADRTGTGTLSVFGMQKRYDLREGFPMVTTKKVTFSNVIAELIWFLRGATNINDGLVQYTKIWNPWAAEDGALGPIYGYQWVKWEKFTPVEGDPGLRPEVGQYKKEHINQVQNAIDLIKTHPESRRIIVSAWNVADLDRMALPPCHAFYQFNVANGFLDLQLYQRSADIALGVPYNIASYSALLAMVAKECNLTPRFFVHTMGDAHIYKNHIEGLQEQLTRQPFPLPQLHIADKPFWELAVEDLTLENYQHHPFIKFPVAV
jgi:thymidylate synthase